MDLEPIDPLAPGIVDNGDLAAMPAFTLKGNNTGVSAAPQDIPIDDVLEDIEPYIDIDATLVELAGIIGRAAISGDVTIAAGSNSATIANDAVTNAKAANMAQATIKGRQAGSGTGDPEDLSVSQVQTIIKDGWASISFGSSPDTGALLNFEHNVVLMNAKTSGGASRTIMQWGVVADTLQVGGAPSAIHGRISSVLFGVYNGSTRMFSVEAAEVAINAGGLLSFSTSTVPVIRGDNRSSGTVQDMIIRAPGTSQSSTASANLLIDTGRSGSGAATYGQGRLRGNRDDTTFDNALRWGTNGSGALLGLYNATPIARQTDVGAAPTDTVANLAAWCETVRTRLRNIGVTA